jgi:hypothetical protein
MSTIFLSSEILALSNQLLQMVKEQNCPYRVVVTKNGIRYFHEEETNVIIEQDYTPIISQEPPMEEVNITPAPTLTRPETRILDGIQNAVDEFECAPCPPRLISNADTLADYFAMLELDRYTQNAIYFEIGRILVDLTAVYPASKQYAEAQNIVKRCIVTTNIKQKVYTAFRIHSYFQQNPGYTLLKNLDQYFKPSAIGRLTEHNSNRLRTRINWLIDCFTEQNTDNAGSVMI